jgi:leucyl-tRNA synthetase
MEYDFKKIETEWQAYWAKHKTFAAKDGGDKPKYYVLDMFPYPSGAGLHVGHPLGYIASDIVSRYKRHKGFNVLHPMGYDSFGLPAEQYAIQTGQHPKITTENNIAVYRRQLDKIGFSFDWDREVRTSNPDYYKWTQWIFIQIFNSWYNKQSNKAENISSLIAEFEINGNRQVNASCDDHVKQFTAEEWKSFSEKEQSDILMAYRIAYLGEAYVNWCPQLGTVLANDEIKDGVSERGGYPVERKLMKQWSMRISAYSQRLLDGLDTLDWTESLKEAQRNWIGKSEGTSLRFKVLTPSPSAKERGTTSQNYLTGKQEIAVELLKKAKANRINYTETEDIIWQALRNRKLDVKFRRQHPIDKFIADFVCLEQRLIVEIDGEYHNDEEQKQLDDARSIILELSGFTVIRFTNNEVLTNLESVINSIKQYCSSPPSPSERGLGGEEIEVFTTRPDTIFGVSFVTLAPEHELVEALTTSENKATVEAYVTQAKNRSERERQADVAKITGVFTGTYVEHPFTGKQIPIWIGDYVLAGYGTGAVMAVPAHDSRDYSFAKHFGLPILEVVSGGDLEKESYDAKEGKLINSDFLNGLDVKEAMKKAIAEIEKQGLGKGKVNFRLRDAVFGRQRYWGEPIPIYYKNDIPYALNENELPLVLPEVDKYLPTEDGEPPLARAASSWKHEGKYDYEHSTMPGWAGSSWYFLRYMDAHNGSTFADKKLTDYWKQIDLYIGGSEHATGHLLYVRFWTKFLKDLGYIDIDEPAKKLINQGMIQGRSNFVYRAFITFSGGGSFDTSERDNEIKSNILAYYKNNPIFISKNLLELFIKEDENATKLIQSSLNEINKTSKQTIGNHNTTISIDPDKRALHVDVNIVTNDILDKDKFRLSREDYKNAHFITEENGDYICGAEVEKMSKSKYNVVTPDDIAEKFGSDTLRLYEMFLGPLEQSKPWNTNGITGVHGFLKKLWRLFYLSPSGGVAQGAGEVALNISNDEPTKGELKTLHKTIKKITDDIERFSFNTSLSN